MSGLATRGGSLLLALLAAAVPVPAPAAEPAEKLLTVGEHKAVWKGQGMTPAAPVFTPDGKRIVFVAMGGGGAKLLVIAADGAGEPADLFAVEGGGLGEPALSPDGLGVAVPVHRKDKPSTVAAGKLADKLREIPGTEGARDLRWLPDSSAVIVGVEGGQVLWKAGDEKAGERQKLPEVPGGPYHPVARSPDGEWCLAAKFVASPKTGIVRPAGLYLWKSPHPGDEKVEVKELLSPDKWLVGVYDSYAGTTFWSPDSKKVRFVGARLDPEPGKPYRPLCVWEMPSEGGDPVKLYEYGWWPKRFWKSWGGWGLAAWRYDIDPGGWCTDYATGATVRLAPKSGLPGKEAFAFGPGCRAIVVMHKDSLSVAELTVAEAPAEEKKP
jgi:hypothetical protein